MTDQRKNSILKIRQPGAAEGFTILEVLVAMGIFAIGILGVATMQVSSTKGNTTARKHTEASEFNQGQIEVLMTEDFDNLANGNAVTPDGYTVTWTIISQTDMNGDGSDDTKVIRVTVTDPSGIQRSSYAFSSFAAL